MIVEPGAIAWFETVPSRDCVLRDFLFVADRRGATFVVLTVHAGERVFAIANLDGGLRAIRIADASDVESIELRSMEPVIVAVRNTGRVPAALQLGARCTMGQRVFPLIFNLQPRRAGRIVTRRCGARDSHELSVSNAPCVLERGHAGEHRDGTGLYWRSSERAESTLSRVLRALRWRVHLWRCERWLRQRDAGASSLAIERAYLSSFYWAQHGRRPSEIEVNRMQVAAWTYAAESVLAERDGNPDHERDHERH